MLENRAWGAICPIRRLDRNQKILCMEAANAKFSTVRKIQLSRANLS